MALGALARVATIADLRELARRRLPRLAFDYLDGGAGADGGLAHNRASLDAWRLVPRYLRDVSTVTTTTRLLGRDYGLPFGIAPTGLANLAGPGTDGALAAAARARSIPFVAATPASTALETLAAACPGFVWFQLYPSTETAVTEDLIARAAGAGIDTLVLTVDIPAAARRARDLRNGFTLPFRLSAGNAWDALRHPGWLRATLAAGSPRFMNLERYLESGADTSSLAAFMARTIARDFTWSALERLRARWPGKLVVKGILDADDAAAVLALGCDGIIVSNHGGRQLEAAVAPWDVLAGIRARVGGKLAIMADSGIRSGSDVLKALALGADFVFLGRAGLYGAAAGGHAGVERALEIVELELRHALAQFGAPAVASLGACSSSPARIHAPPEG